MWTLSWERRSSAILSRRAGIYLYNLSALSLLRLLLQNVAYLTINHVEVCMRHSSRIFADAFKE